MIWSVALGCWPSSARRLRIRWMLSALFSHEPPSGVYKGLMPCANRHRTNAGVLGPARLSSTSSTRKGGNCRARVGFTVNRSVT
jgi:hypothetical protein